MSNLNNKKINLTVICSYFYPKIGGLETIAYTTAKRLHQSGKYKVSVITTNYISNGFKKEVIDGMNVYRLPILFKLSNSPMNFSWFYSVYKIFKIEKTQIIHTHSPVPFLVDISVFIAKIMKIKSVVTYHSGSMKKSNFFPDLLISVYEKYILRKVFSFANRVVTVHQYFMDNNYSEFKYKTSFIPTGVDLERFKPSEINKNTKVVTFIGRIEMSSMWKGIDILLLAFKGVVEKDKNVKLKLVGGGDALDFYKKMSFDLGIENSVEIVGPKYGEDLVSVYRESTVVVLPSTSDSEAFSVTLVESMASGRPVIGTNIGGTPQVIENGKNGLLIEPKNPNALRDAILKIVSDYSYAENLANNGIKISKNFSWEIQTDKYEKLFSELIN